MLFLVQGIQYPLALILFHIHHKIKLNGNIPAASTIRMPQSTLDTELALENPTAPFPLPVALAPELLSTILVAAVALLVRLDPALVVSETPVGAIVVLGSTIPLGPNTTVVPSMIVVVLLFSDPLPMRYVVPLMMASD